MNTLQIDRILSACEPTANEYVGCFAADELPAITKYPCSLVANTDDSDSPGSHWVAFRFPDMNVVQFFDSYGQHPSTYNTAFEDFLIELNREANNNNNYYYPSRSLKKSDLILQSSDSDVCGEYVVYFLSQAANGMDFEDINNPFSIDRRMNDRIVFHFTHAHPACYISPFRFNHYMVIKQVCKTMRDSLSFC